MAGEKESVEKRLAEMEAELKRMKKDLHDERLKSKEVSCHVTGSVSHVMWVRLLQATEKAGGDGLRISRLEIAKVLRERNEWKEKYFSLMEQVRYEGTCTCSLSDISSVTYKSLLRGFCPLGIIYPC